MLGDLELISHRLKLENRSLDSQKGHTWEPSHIRAQPTTVRLLAVKCSLLRDLNLRLLVEKPISLVLLHLRWRQMLARSLLFCFYQGTRRRETLPSGCLYFIKATRTPSMALREH